MIDIDHFKKINDTYGHQTGDEILKEFAKKLDSHVREIDTLARWGGEEFSMMIIESDKKKSCSIANKIRRLVEDINVSVGDIKVNITVSIGCADLLETDSVEALVKRADQALYQAKANGRNLVICKDEADELKSKNYNNESIPVFKT